MLEQWRSQIGVFLDRESKSIGRLGVGKRKLTGEIDVAMIQNLSRKDSVDDIVAEYGQVIIDECHHLPAISFERVLSEVKVRYVVGSTATPQRRDGHQPIIHMQIGPTRFKADPRTHSSKYPFDYRLVVRRTNFDLSLQDSDKTIQELYGLLATDKQRNKLLFNDVLMAMEEGRSPILLTERKEHLEILHEMLKGFVRHIVVLRGGRSAKERREIQEELASIPADEERLLLATEDISVKASMMHGLTRCSYGCQYPGKERLSNTLDDYTAYTLENGKRALLFTSTTMFLCWPRCLKIGVLATDQWVIERRISVRF